MINFNYEIEFQLGEAERLSKWISGVIIEEGYNEGDIEYIFCSDEYLHKINVDFLNHDTLTDVISFDYSVGKELHGEIYISVDRVKENALEYGVFFIDELSRVMIHGILHYCGFKDKTEAEEKVMRSKEAYYLSKR